MPLWKAVVILAVLAGGGWLAYDYFSGDDNSGSISLGNSNSNSGVIYTWADEKGITHYANSTEFIPEKFADAAERVNMSDITVLDSEADNSIKDYEMEKEESLVPDVTLSTRIVLYKTSWCPRCKKIEKLLKELKVGYADFDVEKDPRGMRNLMQLTKGLRAVPVVTIGTRVIVGYHPEQIELAIKQFKMKNGRR